MLQRIPSRRELVQFATHELLKQGAGFLAGLIAYEAVGQYFRVKKWFQFWGFLSQKKAVDADTFNILIFGVSFIIGLGTLYIVNRLVEWIFLPKKQSAEP